MYGAGVIPSGFGKSPYLLIAQLDNSDLAKPAPPICVARY